MLRRIAFRAFHGLRRGDDLLPRWAEAERIQWSEPRFVRKVQTRRLATLLRHASLHVPRYRELLGQESGKALDQLAAGDGWAQIPLLDKSAIRGAPESCLTEDPAVHKLPNATSGSTGESLRFWLDAGSRAGRAASTHRFHRWAGIEPWDRHAKLWGARFDAPGADLRQRMTAFLHPQLFLSSYDMSDAVIREYGRRLVDFQPRALTSYPSPLEHFAGAWPAAGRELKQLRAIICSAEQLRDDQRELFERTFGCPVFDRYGSREFGNVAQECEEHDGLHVAADRLLVEIVRENGELVGEGEVGEVVITDLENRAMPFLRYRTGDRARWATSPCRCGRGLPRLAGIEGRVLDLVHAPDGAVISGTFWPQIVKQASARVRLFQVVQDGASALRIRLVMDPAGPLTDPEQEAILARVRERSTRLEVSFEYVDDIPLTPGGKRRMVVGRSRHEGGE